MPLSPIGRVGIAGVVALALTGAGCGSKSKTSSTASSGGSAPASTSSSGGSSPASTVTNAVKHYRAGEFCSTSKASVYASLGLTCVNGRLKKK